jgi:hypothetical protein
MDAIERGFAIVGIVLLAGFLALVVAIWRSTGPTDFKEFRDKNTEL